jgi:phosphatidylethanolamine/phosphatidyl-N-methylethanolamine N-methyltransferase
MRGSLLQSTLSNEYFLFFKRWLHSPKQLGTIAPISTKLARSAARSIQSPATAKIVEIGAGTGKITRELLQAGVKPENLICVELDPDLASYLQKDIPAIHVIEGNACHLKDILPHNWHHNVDVVFSSIPFMYLPVATREEIAHAAFNVLKQNGRFLHLTYNLWSPLSKFSGKKVVQEWLNLPPGFVWEFERTSGSF